MNHLEAKSFTSYDLGCHPRTRRLIHILTYSHESYWTNVAMENGDLLIYPWKLVIVASLARGYVYTISLNFGVIWNSKRGTHYNPFRKYPQNFLRGMCIYIYAIYLDGRYLIIIHAQQISLTGSRLVLRVTLKQFFTSCAAEATYGYLTPDLWKPTNHCKSPFQAWRFTCKGCHFLAMSVGVPHVRDF